MKVEKNGESLLVYLSGEIDHCCAEKLRRELENLLRDQNVRRLMMDFSRVSFMDSAGIGMLIGRYKTMAERNGSMYIRAMKPSVKKLFYMSGLHRIIAAQETEDRENEK